MPAPMSPARIGAEGPKPEGVMRAFVTSLGTTIKQQAGMLLETLACLGDIAEDGNRPGTAAEAWRHAMERARALEQDERSRVLLQLAHDGFMAVQDASHRRIARCALLPDVRGKLEGPASIRLAEHQRHGEF